VISSVPAKTGTAPKAPDEPTWSARIAVCGLHWSPNRKSRGGTRSKKRAASNTRDRTMPIVARIAISEQAANRARRTVSTTGRARSAGDTRVQASVPSAGPTASASHGETNNTARPGSAQANAT
jgi:hypothetical protein